MIQQGHHHFLCFRGDAKVPEPSVTLWP